MHLRGPLGEDPRYIVTERSIELNLDKISTIAMVGTIKNIKDVQRFMGCPVTLARFMSRLGKCGLPMYKLLKKSDFFYCVEEA
jgi:hypothetical protein